MALDDIDLTLDYVDDTYDDRVHTFWALGAFDLENPTSSFVALGWGDAGQAFLYNTPEAAQDALAEFDDDEEGVRLAVVPVLVVVDPDDFPPLSG